MATSTSTQDVHPSWEARELIFSPISGDGELSPRRNPDSETRNTVLDQSFLQGRVLAAVKGVSSGTYNGKPACLLVLQFRFRETRGRFKDISIFVKFTQIPSNVKHPEPVIRVVSPCQIYGRTTTEQLEMTYNIGAQFSANGGPASAGATLSRDKVSSYQKDHALEISGMPWTSDDEHDEHNMVIWTIRENKKSTAHFPKELNFGMVVERGCGVQATVTLKVNGFHSLAWKEDDPLLLPLDGITKGPVPSKEAFEQLEDSGWKLLVPYREEGQVSHDPMSLNRANFTLKLPERYQRSILKSVGKRYHVTLIAVPTNLLICSHVVMH